MSFVPRPTFLKTDEDIIIFVSCVCGILGAVLICAIIGFFSEHCRCSKKKKRTNQNGILTTQYGNSKHEHEHCENHYPTWLYNTMVHEHAQNMKMYLQNGSPPEKKVPSHDPEHYINEVFSDIFDETNERTKVEKGLVAYEGAKKIITPEKKPVPVLYYSNESNLKTNETANGHLKVSLENEKVEFHKQEVSGGKAIPLDDFDLDLFEMGEPDANKELTKIVIPKELTIGEKIRARHNNQTVEYENPKMLEKERKDRLKEEQKQEEMRAKRVMLERSSSDLRFAFARPEIVKPGIRIPAEKPEKTWPSMEENTTQDSFLY